MSIAYIKYNGMKERENSEKVKKREKERKDSTSAQWICSRTAHRILARQKEKSKSRRALGPEGERVVFFIFLK